MAEPVSPLLLSLPWPPDIPALTRQLHRYCRDTTPGKGGWPAAARIHRLLTAALRAQPRRGWAQLSGKRRGLPGTGGTDPILLTVTWYRRGRVLRVWARARPVWVEEPPKVWAGPYSWGLCWPERVGLYLRLRAARTRRRLLALGLPAPEGKHLGRVLWHAAAARAAVVETLDAEGEPTRTALVLTPLGAFEGRREADPVDTLCRILNLPAPVAAALRARTLDWESLRAEIMAARLAAAAGGEEGM